MKDEAQQLLDNMIAHPVRFITRIGGERFGRQVALLRMKVDPPALCSYPKCEAALLYSCFGCVHKVVIAPAAQAALDIPPESPDARPG